MAPLLDQKIEAVLETVQKPSRYIGGEANQVQKPAATRLIALCYPDAYEIGISNQALQILYTQVNARESFESERAFEAVLDAIDAHPDRAARLRALAEIPCVYTPANGRRPVERAIYADFGIETQPTAPVVPYSSAIFSRASVEVMRGCTRGCRFCHAGTWYRPVRERPPDEVAAAGIAQLGCTGYD